MIAYVESSAVLRLLLGEAEGRAVHTALARAAPVVTSALTGLECARAIARAQADERISARDARALAAQLEQFERAWHVLDLSAAVVERARQPFPVEPVRSLDALHLASAVYVREQLGAVTVVSYDDRLRVNAKALRFALRP